MLLDIMNDHGLEQLVHFLTREKNTLELLLTSLPGQFQDIHSPDKLSDHDIVAGTLIVVITPINKPRRNVYLYQKGDCESMRKGALYLQSKSISMVIQILARYRRTLTWLLLLFKIRRINSSHPKLVRRSLRFPGSPRK